MTGCRTMLAGQCLGISQTNAFMALSLWATAALLFHEWWLEVNQ